MDVGKEVGGGVEGGKEVEGEREEERVVRGRKREW